MSSQTSDAPEQEQSEAEAWAILLEIDREERQKHERPRPFLEIPTAPHEEEQAEKASPRGGNVIVIPI